MIHSIRILVTGGTFDKEYDAIQGRLYFLKTHLNQMLEQGRCKVPIRMKTLMMKDSLLMRPADRQTIADECGRCREKKILITHGTDTMVETATVIASSKLDKTIILTGAMIPYTFGSSDGFFNLGNALAFVQCLPSGVYVVMNGKAFPWNNVRKNRKTGFFEEKR